MPSTHVSLHCHLVFSTKDRARFIKPAWRRDLEHFLGACAKQADITPLAIGAVEDHVHMLVGLKATHRVSDVMRDMKRASSLWVHEQSLSAGFAWQEGYGAFAVSRSNLDAVRQYVESQEEHHLRRSFQDEYLDLLRKHEIEFDERFIW
jgi:putative transposase